jgi:hypothetical protein
VLHSHGQVFEGIFQLKSSLAFGFFSLLVIDLVQLIHSHVHCPLVSLLIFVAHLFIFYLINESLNGVLSDFL